VDDDHSAALVRVFLHGEAGHLLNRRPLLQQSQPELVPNYFLPRGLRVFGLLGLLNTIGAA